MQNKTDTTTDTVLIACADVAYGATLEDFMAHNAYHIDRCHDAAGVLRLASQQNYHIVVFDLALEDESDIELVSFVMEQHPATRLILLFDMHQIDEAVDGIRQGAFFYLPKSSPPSDVALIIQKAVRSREADRAISEFEQTVFEELVGKTPAMQRVVELIQKVSPTDSTVLLLGESGTGKEVLANTIHRLSKRREKPFVAINCAALPEGLLESEMFGHVKGSFTGADRDKVGLFEQADGGTIFLDEIGDMSPILQAKLLRVLQSGEIRRVGAAVSQRVDVRIIAATNVDLLDAVATSRFREDLYFRLNVIQIRIPPLRERMDALPSLVSHFLAQSNTRFGKRISGLDEQATSLLRHYDFPGNVRELESIIAHAVILADESVIRARDLPDNVVHGTRPRLALGYEKDDNVPSMAEMEKRHIAHALEVLEGNQTKVAEQLGISRSTLWRKLKEYGLSA
jgi:DNA-binding NtrC family response regulator